MFFTQDDYKKIQAWLTKNSVKDTEFNEAIEPLNGNETISLVQNGHNVKASLKDFISQLFLLGVSDFLNVSERFNEKYISLSEAIKLIPFKSRKTGQVITFLDENGEWKLYQFQGERVNQWNNTTLWIDLIKAISGEGNIVPDEEDITGVEQEDKTVLKFKDKAYNKDDYSGLGRVYLRKNITTVTDYESGCEITTNLLTQNMIGKENTIYKIQYDYNLNGQTIVIPENCVLDFQGGSFSNGTIVGNNTNINFNSYSIFNNIEIDGIWELKTVDDLIFSYIENSVENNTKILKSLIALTNDNIYNIIYISRKYIYLPDFDRGLLVKSNTEIKGGGVIEVKGNEHAKYNVFFVKQKKNVVIEDITLIGDVETHIGTQGEYGFGIKIGGSSNVLIRNCNISKFWGDGIDIQKGIWEAEQETPIEKDYEYHNRNIVVEYCNINYNRRNNISIECGFDVTVRNCNIGHAGAIKGTLPMSGIDIEPIAENRQIVKDIIIENCNIHDSAKYGIMVSTPTNNEGFIKVKDSEIENILSWASLSNVDITLDNVTQTKEGSTYFYSGKSINIYNSKELHLVLQAPIVRVSNSKFRASTLRKIQDGYILDCIFENTIYIERCSNCSIYNLKSKNIGFIGICDNIVFNECSIVTSNRPIISFESSADIRNSIFNKCVLIGKATNTGPFTGIAYKSTNCYFFDCDIKMDYNSDYVWLPFDKFEKCRIDAEKIKALHESMKFKNCDVKIKNPIRLLDISNNENVQYVFDNTTINGVTSIVNKTSNNNITYISIYGKIERSLINRSIKYTQDSFFASEDKYYSNIVKIFAQLISDSKRSACFRLPDVHDAKVIINITPSDRYITIPKGQKIIIDISKGVPSAAYIGSSSNTMTDVKSLSEYYTVKYRIIDDIIEIHLLNKDRNVGANSEITLISERTTTNAIDASWTDKVQESELTNIDTYLSDIIYDTTNNIKTVDTTLFKPLNSFSTDNNKPIWWTGSNWVDATGADV